MYLAKFFHRAPGDNDKELLFIPGDEPIVMGIHMHGDEKIGEDEFLREEFSDIRAAVTVFRHHAAELAAAGYMETTHTRYTLRNLLPDPQPKPAWQKGLDELMLAALSAPLEEQAKQLAALRGTEAAREPLYLWLAAHHAYSDETGNGKTMRFAEQARDTLASRRAGKMPHYAWSIPESELEARIFEVLSWAHLRAEDPAEALAAIEEAFRIDPSQDREVQRCTILCEHFPERQEEAFDSAFKYAEFGGFEEIMAQPAYKEYLAARKRRKKSDKGWRWSGKAPASEAELRDAEARLGSTLPNDYRKFLATTGASELRVRLSDHSGELRFYRPSELATQRDKLVNFITRTEADDTKAADYFRREYGVSLRHLVPVAEPTQQSRCVLIHLEPGERFGWCFHWDHDGAWELEQPTSSFDAALKALTGGIEKRDESMLGFLGIYID
jgi:SMI1/KNR4 family protein SUKH-1